MSSTAASSAVGAPLDQWLHDLEMRVRQYVYFAITSTRVAAAEISLRLNVEPDQATVRGSRSDQPPRPAAHRWKIVCEEPGLRVDEQIAAVVDRLTPFAARIGTLLNELLRDDPEDAHAVLQIVRYFNEVEGEEDKPTPADLRFTKLEGQHHLLGFGIDNRTLGFLHTTGATISVDEYG